MQTIQTWSFTDGIPPMRPTFLTEAIQTIRINHDEHRRPVQEAIPPLSQRKH
jgi:hypothetical protein